MLGVFYQLSQADCLDNKNIVEEKEQLWKAVYLVEQILV